MARNAPVPMMETEITVQQIRTTSTFSVAYCGLDLMGSVYSAS
jgi:hypothetical protein